MNKLDSSLVSAALAERGFELTEQVNQADAVILNTCSVRQHAEDRVLSHLGHLRHLKKSRPDLVVVVMGCMAQRLGKELLDQHGADIVVGPNQIHQIPDLIQQTQSERKKHLDICAQIRKPPEDPAVVQVNQKLDEFEVRYDSDENHLKSQAFIRVMRGCNNFCSYCIVPYVRGPEMCRHPKAIFEQAKKLAERGIQQITLLGQTVNAYRYQDGQKSYTLADLLEMISQLPTVHWVRFITSHPAQFDPSIFDLMAQNPKICPYLHIPAQSGSDRILSAMKRRYTAKQYLELIDLARQKVPHIAIAGDFIVGFPGETEQDFQQTVDLVKKVRYKNCFIFKYSPRPGTFAQKHLSDDVSDEVKQQRNEFLLDLVGQIAQQDNQRFVGKTVEVLVEGVSKKSHINQDPQTALPQLIGRTADDYIVVFHGKPSLEGRFVHVEIEKASALTLFGKIKNLPF